MLGVWVNQIIKSEVNSAHIVLLDAVRSTHCLYSLLHFAQIGAPVSGVGVRVDLIAVQGRVMLRAFAHQFRGVYVGRGGGDLHGRFNLDRMNTTQKVLIIYIFHVKISF